MQVCGRLWVVISSKVRCAKAAGGVRQTKKKPPTSIRPPVSIFATSPPSPGWAHKWQPGQGTQASALAKTRNQKKHPRGSSVTSVSISKDMTTCQRVFLKLGTTHPTSQINLVWYLSAVCVLSFKEKTISH